MCYGKKEKAKMMDLITSRRSVLRMGLGVATAMLLPACRSPLVSDAKETTRPASGLWGTYGFLTYETFAPQSDADVRARVATMATEFGVREFQFYDWFADYSTPTRGDQWTDPYFRRSPISRRSLEVGIDEIHRRGGRAWAYVQAVAAEETDLEIRNGDVRKLVGADGKWYWHAPGKHPRFPTYLANAAWAEVQVGRWARPAKALGFDGLHWDTLGHIAGDVGAETAGIHAFLRTARPLLEREGMRQTMNFVDLAWWDRAVAIGQVEFPYVEAWSQRTADCYYAEMDSPDMIATRGVMAMYPTTAVPPNVNSADLIRVRHEACEKHRLSYLIVGDGARRMKNEYWPDTVALSPSEVDVLRVGRERCVACVPCGLPPQRTIRPKQSSKSFPADDETIAGSVVGVLDRKQNAITEFPVRPFSLVVLDVLCGCLE